MKRKIALLLAVVMAVGTIANLTACKKTDEGSDPSATEPSDLLTQAPTETTPSETEPNEDYKNDIVYYPFPLLDMTVGEIEQKYGKVNYEDTSQSWLVCSIDRYEDIDLYFDVDITKLNNSNHAGLITSDLIPHHLFVRGDVYPDIKRGMRYKYVDFKNMTNHELQVVSYQEVNTFQASELIQVEDCVISVQLESYLPWEIVEKYLGYNISRQEAFEQAINGNLTIQPEDILDWLQDGHMDEIEDLEISSIEIRKQN